MAYDMYDIPEHIKNSMEAAKTVAAAGIEIFNEFVRAYQIECEMRDLLIRALKELQASCSRNPKAHEDCRKCSEVCITKEIAWYLEEA